MIVQLLAGAVATVLCAHNTWAALYGRHARGRRYLRTARTMLPGMHRAELHRIGAS